jgi:hypothetical protein
MLTSDEGDTSYGIPIEKVQQAFNQWNFPFTLTPPTAGSTSATPRQRETFADPIYEGLRLDACYYANATGCGEMAATAWCQTKGYTSAVEYPQENVGLRGIHTKQIGSKAECAFNFCASFTSITCVK